MYTGDHNDPSSDAKTCENFTNHLIKSGAEIQALYSSKMYSSRVTIISKIVRVSMGNGILLCDSLR